MALMGQESNDQAARFIQGLVDEAISILRIRTGSIAEREKKLRTVLRDDFAMVKIGRFAAGKYWRQMNKEQKQKYQQLFEEWILKTYSIRFGGYSDETVKVLKTIKVGKADIYVRTNIEGKSARTLNIDWRVRRINGRYKIIDVVVEGVSMLVTQKAEFGGVLAHYGIDGLIRILQAQLVRLSNTPKS